ncbi:hypothetical protein OFO11_34710, partial [Escherichia coli]|nr:hypothetical protein [Escherichia coli]
AESYLLDLSWGNFGNCSISYGQFYCLQHGSSNPNLIAKMQKYVCPEGQQFNQETGRCEDPKYCERPEVIAQIESSRSQCESQGKQFS